MKITAFLLNSDFNKILGKIEYENGYNRNNEKSHSENINTNDKSEEKEGID
ncbi:MAG: hypothetical protein ACOCP8_02060 [archaeon]